MADSTLAPIAQPPAPKAAGEIPVDKIKVPAGFKVSLWAHGISNAREMVWGDKGTLFVSSRVAGNVYAVVDNGGSREVKVIAKGLNLPNGVAFRNGTLYIAEVSRITKMVGIEDKLDTPPAMEVVYDILPRDLPHGWKHLAFGPDGKLYFNIGAPCNICLPPDTHANLSRVNPDGTGFEYVAHGVRNSVGFDWHPVTKRLYFTTHARDWMGEDSPSDRFDVVTRKGQHFGYPFCHAGDMLDPEFGKGKSCNDYVKPLLKTGPHVAGNGVEFYTGAMFPAEYQNRAFLAQRGSWNRSKKIGFRVMMVTIDAKGGVAKYEPFAEGWLQGEEIWGRPVYTRQMKDGSLLIADDYAGAIYRVSYSR
jgi:glucose/arabinose dehydrogenase